MTASAAPPQAPSRNWAALVSAGLGAVNVVGLFLLVIPQIVGLVLGILGLHAARTGRGLLKTAVFGIASNAFWCLLVIASVIVSLVSPTPDTPGDEQAEDDTEIHEPDTEPEDDGEEEEAENEDEDYTLTLTVDTDGDMLTVEGDTDLPDGTLVTLGASRSFTNPGGDPDDGADLRAALPTELHDTEVDGGIYAAQLDIDESDLLVGLDLPGEEIELLASHLHACATVATGISSLDGDHRQPDDQVREVLGDNGETLADHPDAFVFGADTDEPSHWLEISQPVEAAAPTDEVSAAQGNDPEVSDIDGFCFR
jgi:hypothetical protein